MYKLLSELNPKNTQQRSSSADTDCSVQCAACSVELVIAAKLQQGKKNKPKGFYIRWILGQFTISWRHSKVCKDFSEKIYNSGKVLYLAVEFLWKLFSRMVKAHVQKRTTTWKWTLFLWPTWSRQQTEKKILCEPGNTHLGHKNIYMNA